MRNKPELRTFFGFCSGYRRFVSSFVHIASPLNDMLWKGSLKTFYSHSVDQLGSIKKLIKALTSAPILHLWKPHQPYFIDTDGSVHHVGCVLFQTAAENICCLLRCFNQTLHAAVRNYPTTKNKCLTVIWALQTLRPHLAREDFTVSTGRNSSHWLLSVSEPSELLIRCRLRLSEIDIDILYKTGIKNCQAEALSRLRANAEEKALTAKLNILTFEPPNVVSWMSFIVNLMQTITC